MLETDMKIAGFVFDTSAAQPLAPTGRIVFGNHPGPFRQVIAREEEERITLSKLDRLAEELHALGIDF